MSIQIDGQTTIRELVGRWPQTRQVFEAFQIDYCCGGGGSVAAAATERGVKLSTLVDALTASLRDTPGNARATDTDWYSAPLSELVEHIVETHHGYIKTALPRLRSLVPTVLKAHGAHHGDVLRQVQSLFNSLDSELSHHLLKEEQVLFPYVVTLENRDREGTGMSPSPFGTVQNPIRQMEYEHESREDIAATP